MRGGQIHASLLGKGHPESAVGSNGATSLLNSFGRVGVEVFEQTCLDLLHAALNVLVHSADDGENGFLTGWLIVAVVVRPDD